MLQRRAVNNEQVSEVPPIVHEVVNSHGQPLDPATRAFFEPHFGHDFSQVRVHTDAKAAESARAVNALAYTMGQDVVFGAGQYMTGASKGRQLLAHELAHVVQQSASANVTSNQTINGPCDAFEQDAELAAGLTNTGSLSAFSLFGYTGAPRLQRQQAEEENDSSLFDGTIAKYRVNKQGKILNWNMDQIAQKVFQALSASKNAYIRVNGRYPVGDTDFDPNSPIDIARSALIQWIGKSKITDIEARIVTYHGSGGPYPKDTGGEVEIKLAYSGREPSTGLKPSPGLGPSPNPSSKEPIEEPDKPKDQAEEESKLSKEENDVTLFGGTIAKYRVNKQGKILKWNMDQIAQKVVKALSASKNAYIRVNGYYPLGDTDFDPNSPIDIARSALIQWIGKSKITDIESRIATYFGSGGPFPKDIGGEVEIELTYSSIGPSPGLGPYSNKELSKEPGKSKEEAEEDSGLEKKVNIIPVEVSLPYNKEYKQKLTIVISYQLPPIKKFSGPKVDVPLVQFEVGFEGGPGAGGKIGEQPKKIWVAELGVSVTIVGVKFKEQLAVPKDMKIGLGLGFTGNIAEDKAEIKGQFKLENKNYFLKVEGGEESLQFSVGVQFDVADLFKKNK